VETTWDGLPITPEWPWGATVVVSRRSGARDGDVLLLHRAHHGPDFAGDWAWTTPAGARQPGESILAGALRELAEEAGLTSTTIEPIDLSGRWALFAAEFDAHTTVTLHDQEHDQFAWVRPSEASTRVRPAVVAGGIRRALATPLPPITFRPLQRTDFPNLVTWQNADHVRPWWDDAIVDVEAAETEYGPNVDGTAPTLVDIILVDGQPAGFIQHGPLHADDDYLETAGWVTDGGADAVAIDYAIGVAAHVGIGLGTRVIWAYLRDIVFTRVPGTRFIVADPATRNVASVRACEKAGFRRIFDFAPEPGSPRHALCLWERDRVVG
jgi:8-oxo-dGTP pyrophosphatase MutT (NUDIX family)/RimJ/RimL family protein N-acetyltransferase